MEAVRPPVDSYVLALPTQRTLRKPDFVETDRARAGFKPRLAAGFVETLPAWRWHVGR